MYGDSLTSKGGGRLRELRMADGSVEVENRKGSGMTSGILEAGSTGHEPIIASFP